MRTNARGLISQISSHIVGALAIAGTVVLLSSCRTAPPPLPPLTQLQIREMQSRTFETSDDRMVLKAVVNLLQDEGFIVKNAQPELGLVFAEKQEPLAKKEIDTNPILAALAVVAVVAAVAVAVSGTKNSTSGKRTPTTPPNSDNNTENNTPPPPKPVATKTEISVNVTTREKRSIVRFSAQRSVLSDKGTTLTVEQVLDSQYYQKLFGNLDKSLFLQRSGF